MKINTNNLKNFRKAVAILVLGFFLFSAILPPQAYAQISSSSLLDLPLPGEMVHLTPGFHPALIKGMTVHPENPLEFNFFIDQGDFAKDDQFNDEAKKLVKYFLAALTTPEKDLWVNLSPYEKDRIIPKGFDETEMGRDLLAQDYLLKQLTSSLMYPEDKLGAEFWENVYERAKEEYGVTEIPVETFNKVWIVPEKAVVYEHEMSAFVLESRLKVMLEIDYEASKNNNKNDAVTADKRSAQDYYQHQDVATEVIRQIIIPAIEKEVNEGENFAPLRQIYNSLILATWYKMNLKGSLLGQVYVDQNKNKGIEVQDKEIKQKIYQQYLEAFRKGVYNYIKEEYDPLAQQIIPRKYFAGGKDFSQISHIITSTQNKDLAMQSLDKKELQDFSIRLTESGEETRTIEEAYEDIGAHILTLMKMDKGKDAFIIDDMPIDVEMDVEQAQNYGLARNGYYDWEMISLLNRNKRFPFFITTISGENAKSDANKIIKIEQLHAEKVKEGIRAYQSVRDDFNEVISYIDKMDPEPDKDEMDKNSIDIEKKLEEIKTKYDNTLNLARIQEDKEKIASREDKEHFLAKATIVRHYYQRIRDLRVDAQRALEGTFGPIERIKLIKKINHSLNSFVQMYDYLVSQEEYFVNNVYGKFLLAVPSFEASLTPKQVILRIERLRKEDATKTIIHPFEIGLIGDADFLRLLINDINYDLNLPYFLKLNKNLMIEVYPYQMKDILEDVNAFSSQSLPRLEELFNVIKKYMQAKDGQAFSSVQKESQKRWRLFKNEHSTKKFLQMLKNAKTQEKVPVTSLRNKEYMFMYSTLLERINNKMSGYLSWEQMLGMDDVESTKYRWKLGRMQGALVETRDIFFQLKKMKAIIWHKSERMFGIDFEELKRYNKNSELIAKNGLRALDAKRTRIGLAAARNMIKQKDDYVFDVSGDYFNAIDALEIIRLNKPRVYKGQIDNREVLVLNMKVKDNAMVSDGTFRLNEFVLPSEADIMDLGETLEQELMKGEANPYVSFEELNLDPTHKRIINHYRRTINSHNRFQFYVTNSKDGKGFDLYPWDYKITKQYLIAYFENVHQEIEELKDFYGSIKKEASASSSKKIQFIASEFDKYKKNDENSIFNKINFLSQKMKLMAKVSSPVTQGNIIREKEASLVRATITNYVGNFIDAFVNFPKKLNYKDFDVDIDEIIQYFDTTLRMMQELINVFEALQNLKIEDIQTEYKPGTNDNFILINDDQSMMTYSDEKGNYVITYQGASDTTWFTLFAEDRKIEKAYKGDQRKWIVNLLATQRMLKDISILDIALPNVSVLNKNVNVTILLEKDSTLKGYGQAIALWKYNPWDRKISKKEYLTAKINDPVFEEIMAYTQSFADYPKYEGNLSSGWNFENKNNEGYVTYFGLGVHGLAPKRFKTKKNLEDIQKDIIRALTVEQEVVKSILSDAEIQHDSAMVSDPYGDGLQPMGEIMPSVVAQLRVNDFLARVGDLKQYKRIAVVMDKDNTLTDANTPITKEMLAKLVELFRNDVEVVIMTGGMLELSEDNVIKPIEEALEKNNLADKLKNFTYYVMSGAGKITWNEQGERNAIEYSQEKFSDTEIVEVFRIFAESFIEEMSKVMDLKDSQKFLNSIRDMDKNVATSLAMNEREAIVALFHKFIEINRDKLGFVELQNGVDRKLNLEYKMSPEKQAAAAVQNIEIVKKTVENIVKKNKEDLPFKGVDISGYELNYGKTYIELALMDKVDTYRKMVSKMKLYEANTLFVEIGDSPNDFGFLGEPLKASYQKTSKKMSYCIGVENAPEGINKWKGAIGPQATDEILNMLNGAIAKSRGKDKKVVEDHAMIIEKSHLGDFGLQDLDPIAGTLNQKPDTSTKGGIDLNPNKIDFQIKRDGRGIPLPVSQQQIENIHIDGFVPVIINVTPVTNLNMLLGLEESKVDPGIS